MDKLYQILNPEFNQWSFEYANEIFNLPFSDLIFYAQTMHRKNFNPNIIQISSLLSIKTGNCPENCAYCPQSAHYNTDIKKEALMNLESVIEAAKIAKKSGSTRFCMGAAWRDLHDKYLPSICQMIQEVKKLGLETCVTLGMLKEDQIDKLKAAGLDFYNHNIDTSPDYYNKIVTTRKFQDRLQTLEYVRKSGIKLCCGGILGMGESNDDRIKMLIILRSLDEYPESVPMNKLIKIPGTPLEDAKEVDPIDFVRTIALARIMMPKSYIRLSAGRQEMSEELQALCFLAGVNSIFYGEKLLTAENPIPEKDNQLFQKLGLQKMIRL